MIEENARELADKMDKWMYIDLVRFWVNRTPIREIADYLECSYPHLNSVILRALEIWEQDNDIQ